MRIPNDARIMQFAAAAPGDFFLSRIRSADPTFFALRAKPHEKMGNDAPLAVVLTSTLEEVSRPFHCELPPTLAILNFGRAWSVHVLLSDQSPEFEMTGNSLLIRVGSDFFIRLNQDGLYLNLSTGNIEVEPPSYNRPSAFWNTFGITLEIEGIEQCVKPIVLWPND